MSRRAGTDSIRSRVVALVAIAALLAAAALADRHRPATVRVAATRTSGMAVAPPASALNASWYCPGAGATNGGPADGSVDIANPGDDPVTATVTVVPSSGPTKSKDLTVGPRSRVSVKEFDVNPANAAAALVELHGGVAVVEQVVTGPGGTDAGPCATAASDHWYFAAGSTERDNVLQLELFNPFPGDAIVDLSFTTDEGPTAPHDFQGLVIPARGLTVVDVGAHVRRRTDVATTVTARSGRIVAGRIQIASGPSGLTSTVGVPATATEWTFPDGLAADGINERYRIYNPGSREADVQVAMALDQGEAEPFTLTVPPAGAVDLVSNNESRIPKGVPHAAVISSTNGVGIVAERVVDGVKPAPRLGTEAVFGSRMAAARWVFASGGPTAALDEWISVYNPGTKPAAVSVVGFANGQPLPVEGLQGVVVAPGRRAAFRLGDHVSRPDLPLIVEATGPVVAERGIFSVNGNGLSGAVGVPWP